MGLVYVIASVVFDPLFFIMAYLTYFFYKKKADLQEQSLSLQQKPAKYQAVDAILQGIVTGLLGSWIMKIIGLPLEITKTCLLLLPLALLLSRKNPRLACFSYAAPIVGALSLLIPSLTLDIPGIISLVASLHFMEGILVYLTGGSDSMPVMLKRDEEYVGAYMMQKYWPLPIALSTPLQGLTPLCGILGFASIAVTSTPEEKARKMGLLIVLYAIILIGGARIANIYPAYKWLILFLTPLLHEAIYHLDCYTENNKLPIYTRPATGIRVLDVETGSYGYEMGLKRGDVILTINNSVIENTRDYHKFLEEGHHKIILNVEDLKGKKQVLQCSAQGANITELGIVPLPNHSLTMFMIKDMC